MTTLKMAARETNIYFDVSLIFKPIKHNQRFCMSRTYVRQEKWPKKKNMYILLFQSIIKCC